MLQTEAISETNSIQGTDLILLPNFIGAETQEDLVTWAKSMRPHLNANGAGRTFSKLQRLPTVSPYLRQTRMRLQQYLNLPADIQPESMFGWYLSIISDGGAVHAHLDAAPEGTRHLRCNLFLQLPEVGGFPVVEGQSIKVEERMILGFFPNEKKHSSETVSGDRWRMICSFGYIVPLEYRLPMPSKPIPPEDRSAVMAGGGRRIQGPGPGAGPGAGQGQGQGQGRGAGRPIKSQDRRQPGGAVRASATNGRASEV